MANVLGSRQTLTSIGHHARGSATAGLSSKIRSRVRHPYPFSSRASPSAFSILKLRSDAGVLNVCSAFPAAAPTYPP